MSHARTARGMTASRTAGTHPKRPDLAGSRRSWTLLAVGALAATIVVIALSPLGSRYAAFVHSAFGRSAPTCADPGRFTRVAAGDVARSASKDGATITFDFADDRVDLGLVCIGNSGADRVTLTTDEGDRSTTLPGSLPSIAPAVEQVSVAAGPTASVVLHVDRVRRGSSSVGAVSAVAFYASP